MQVADWPTEKPVTPPEGCCRFVPIWAPRTLIRPSCCIQHTAKLRLFPILSLRLALLCRIQRWRYNGNVNSLFTVLKSAVQLLWLTHSLTAALDQLRVVASSTSNDPGPRSRQHQQIGQRLLTTALGTLSYHPVTEKENCEITQDLHKRLITENNSYYSALCCAMTMSCLSCCDINTTYGIRHVDRR